MVNIEIYWYIHSHIVVPFTALQHFNYASFWTYAKVDLDGLQSFIYREYCQRLYFLLTISFALIIRLNISQSYCTKVDAV
ncbi:unnamed protein product [Cylicocyclus nassatus]|uniref:Uncharacterized protein n=1 Tax=Cylicocyclus nassatus TaxID=53992 RepID=A0AA36GT28_CYLNA|nr:unnamed protein product [Cylicocyclus nassatus]